MAYEEFYPVFLGVVLLVTHYLSDRIHLRHKQWIASFSVGVSLTYIFIYLLPETIVIGIPRIVLGFTLFGIVLARIVEIHASRHNNKAIMKREMREIHSSMVFVYSFVTGMVIMEFSKISATNAILFVIPIILHAAVSSISISQIHQSMVGNTAIKLFLSASTLLGIVAGYFIGLASSVFAASLGMIVGIMLYTVIRDSMPKNRAAKPVYFVSGIVIYYLIIEATRLLVV